MLKVDDKIIVQSGAINRYLARELGTYTSISRAQEYFIYYILKDCKPTIPANCEMLCLHDMTKFSLRRESSPKTL